MSDCVYNIPLAPPVSGMQVVVNFFVSLAQAVAFAFFGVYENNGRFFSATGVLLSVIYVLLLIIRFRKQRTVKGITSGYLVLTALIWFALGVYAGGFALLIMALLLTLTSKPAVLKVYADRVDCSMLPGNTRSWEGLQQVCLKEGVLTVDCRDNTLIQLTPDPSVLPDADSFNKYCASRIGNLVA